MSPEGVFLGLSAKVWLVIGLLGQIAFGSRFLVQWIYSEYKGESQIPEVFWYLSIFGGITLLFYAISIKSPVFILGQSLGVFVYARNLRLIHKKKKREVQVAPNPQVYVES